MSNALLALVILAIVAVLYVIEIILITVTTVMGCLGLQVATFSVTFSVLASYSLWLVIGMVCVGKALFENGLADEMGKAIIKLIGASETKIILIVYPIVMVMSAFLNNTSWTASFSPIIQAPREISCLT